MQSLAVSGQRDSESQLILNKRLPELVTLERILSSLQAQPGTREMNIHFPVPVEVRTETILRYIIKGKEIEFPVYSIVIGCEDKTAPCLSVFGGVHGLERIGASVVIAYLQTVSELLTWDLTFRERLKKTRLAFMPIVNPIGMCLTRRANGNGVDLMRNAPVVAEEEPAFLLGGQLYSNKLPWFRGNSHSAETMEAEAQAVARFVEREVFPSRVSLAVDVHSGFGSVDRLWFPYARTRKAPPNIVEIAALKQLFDRSYPNHIYKIEPQAKSYTTHGDLWDWLYDRQRTEFASNPMHGNSPTFIPWTLELGSWIWLKKNPRQVFSSLGAFNPGQPHRLKRILRRHLTLFDFLQRALLSPEPWTKLDDDNRRHHLRQATDLWYAR